VLPFRLRLLGGALNSIATALPTAP